ncbi:hypothetical protein [unidentified bacterial endosymbiont]|jgi:hypothetical protein|uniref:hypothetical protein n=1 Tax=unidentified bacterial endosymbiont TaxID=2355 RepID=UPI00209F0192|nr:hypothetical protein [unidentified bacterial endosymbiont]
MENNLEAQLKIMDREFKKLDGFFNQFMQFKVKVEDLTLRAPSDPVAMKQLTHLNSLVPVEIEEIEREMKKEINSLRLSLKKVLARIQLTAGSEVKNDVTN